MVRAGVVLGLGAALAGGPAVRADEAPVPRARSGTFRASARGFFVCTYTPTSPVETPDCFLGYAIPDGKAGHGQLRAVGSGFQRSSNFTVLEEISVGAGALTIGTGRATVDVTFPDLGRLRAELVAGTGGPGWANSACPRTVLAYALAAGGTDAATVFPVTAVRGTLSRHQTSEEVTLYEPPRAEPAPPVRCFAYFTGATSGVWRMSAPQSAGHRRFPEPPPVPSWGPWMRR